MALERKLKIALPTGNLADPDKWSVYRIMELAGLGNTYLEDGRNNRKEMRINFNDPEIEPLYLRAGDIPLVLEREMCDIGITGEDYIKERESHRKEFTFIKRAPLDVLLDMKCGYVELAFLINPKDCKDWLSENPDIKEDNLNPETLKSFLLNWGNRNKNPAICDLYNLMTEYPGIARELFLREFGVKLTEDNNYCWRVMGRHNRICIGLFRPYGKTEELVKLGVADLILENIATGDSMKKRGLAVLGTVMDSTAKLYAREPISLLRSADRRAFLKKYYGGSDMAYLEEAYKSKSDKTEELKARFEAVINDIKEHCQVEIPLNVTYKDTEYPHVNYAKHTFFADFFEFLKESSRGCFFRTENSKFKARFTTKKTNLPRILELSRKLDSSYQNEDYPGRIDFKNIRAYNLQSLYLYCPLLSREGFNFLGEYKSLWEDLKGPLIYRYESDGSVTKIHVNEKEVKRNKNYPCADSTKLRPKHLKDALIELPGVS